MIINGRDLSLNIHFKGPLRKGLDMLSKELSDKFVKDMMQDKGNLSDPLMMLEVHILRKVEDANIE